MNASITFTATVCSFSIDASVHIAARDRAGLERLLHYCARPPFALERLEATGYGAPGGERIGFV